MPQAAILIALPAIVWLLSARTIGWTIGVALVLWAGVAIGAAELFPRANAEIVIACLPVATAIVWFGRKQAGGPPRGRNVHHLAVTLSVVVLVACAPFLFLDINDEPFLPSEQEVLPLPKGMTADVRPATVDGCGVGACTRIIYIDGGSAIEVRRHLNRRGWWLTGEEWNCKPVGWLFDQRDLCASVIERDGRVIVGLESGRAWP